MAQQQKLWLVKTCARSSVTAEFLVIGFNNFNARLNAENILMQAGDVHWDESIVEPASVDDTLRLLGDGLHAYALGSVPSKKN